MMNMVILNNTKHTTHTAYDSALLAMMNVVSANDMASNFFFQPAMILTTTYNIGNIVTRIMVEKRNNDETTDVFAINDKKVSITYLTTDRTDYILYNKHLDKA